MIREYYLLRHLDRDSAYEILPEGIIKTREKAKWLIREYHKINTPAILGIIPSCVKRNIITRDILEEEIKKFDPASSLLTELKPEELLGYNSDNPAVPGFNKYLNLLNEQLAGEFWLADQNELTAFI